MISQHNTRESKEDTGITVKLSSICQIVSYLSSFGSPACEQVPGEPERSEGARSEGIFFVRRFFFSVFSGSLFADYRSRVLYLSLQLQNEDKIEY